MVTSAPMQNDTGPYRLRPLQLELRWGHLGDILGSSRKCIGTILRIQQTTPRIFLPPCCFGSGSPQPWFSSARHSFIPFSFHESHEGDESDEDNESDEGNESDDGHESQEGDESDEGK